MRILSVLAIVVFASHCLRGENAPLIAKEVNAARKLYNLKCLKCHKNYPPTNYNDTDWHDWMEKMRKKAHLNSEQYELLIRYTATLRHPEGGPGVSSKEPPRNN